jgi:hypothetical protein
MLRFLPCASLFVCLLVPVLDASAGSAPDITPPTITAVATPPPNAAGWNRSKVTVKFVCSDAESGIKTCPKAIVVTTEGAGQEISGTARDRAGNTATASITLNLDRTPPAMTAAREPEANALGWTDGPVQVTFEASDALSGLAPGTLTAPITFSTNGKRTAVGRATDLAGNVGTVKLPGINIDLRNPGITVALSPAVTSNGWRTAPVTAHFTCTDGGSGIASCPADQVFPNDGTGQTVTGTATDNVGHSKTVSKTFKIDQTPPAIAVSLSPPPDANGVHTGPVTVHFTCSDGGSGMAACPPDQLIATEGDDQAVSGVARDRAGNTATAEASVTIHFPPVCTNLVEDPGFESGISGFTAQDDSSQVSQTSVSPLAGSYSLLASINGYGNNLWWVREFGGTADRFKVSALLRSDLASTSDLQFCAMAYYEDGETALQCTPVSGAAGDKGVVDAEIDLDPARPLASVRIRMYQEGSDPVQFTLDTASACLEGASEDPDDPPPPPPPPPPDEPQCAPSTSGAYPGFTYVPPAARPFISLDDYAQVDVSSTAYQRFKAAADAAVAGNPPYAYSATHSVMMFRLTGEAQYIADAIARVEQHVQEAEAVIATGNRPLVSGDSYLEVGFYLEALALTYDYGFALLTDAQRARWLAYADQAIYNVWNPALAEWGGVSHPWSGWSICDPGNNYHYSFLRATMLWAWATQNTTWLTFLQSQKFGPLVDYFAALAGGGSREGTGYGTAQKNLFENYIYWQASTGEDLAGLTPHTRETIDYWVHATVPTRDRFAPIGDQSRSSVPELYDYHENLVHAAVVLSGASDQARRGTWWLQNNSVNGVAHSFNLAGDLLPYPVAPIAPTDLAYHASATGHFFARSGWDTGASWLSFVAGKYDQSHAHHDQGSFTFFKGDWLAVTSNIWSHSGINQTVDAHNVLRFVRNGAAIEQNPSTTLQSSMTYSNSGGTVSVFANLTNAYSQNASAIQSWTRDLEFAGDVLRVHDACSVAADVQPVFQVHVPVAPVVQPDGSIQAGTLHIVPLHPVNVAIVNMAMANADYNSGYRVDLTVNSGCTFDIELRAQ